MLIWCSQNILIYSFIISCDIFVEVMMCFGIFYYYYFLYITFKKIIYVSFLFFCKNVKARTVTFDQFNASLLNKTINLSIINIKKTLLDPKLLNGSFRRAFSLPQFLFSGYLEIVQNKNFSLLKHFF